MTALQTRTEFDSVPVAPLPNLKARDQRWLERDGYVVMATAAAFDAMTHHGVLAASVQGARAFVILCAVALPLLGLWAFAF